MFISIHSVSALITFCEICTILMYIVHYNIYYTLTNPDNGEGYEDKRNCSVKKKSEIRNRRQYSDYGTIQYIQVFLWSTFCILLAQLCANSYLTALLYCSSTYGWLIIKIPHLLASKASKILLQILSVYLRELRSLIAIFV